MQAQSAHKRLELGKTFIKKVRVREVLDTMLWKEEDKIFNNIENYFKQHDLDLNKRDDYEFFQSNMMREFLFSKRHILDRVRYKYQHIPYEELTRFINEINKGNRKQVIYSSGLYKTLKDLLNEEMEQTRKYTVPKYLELIKRWHEPIDLNLKRNGKPVTAKDLDMEVYVITNNADYQKVNILDKENNQLLKPEGYKYEQIQKLVIKYKGKEFEFIPSENLEKLPRKLKEVKSFISKYSYEEIPTWDVEVQETGNIIGIKLTNVVEANVIKNKEKKKDSLRRIKN